MGDRVCIGDGIQAMKTRVLEIADKHMVSKCDRHDAFKTVRDLKSYAGPILCRPRRFPNWNVPIISTSAEMGEGIKQLVAAISEYT